jgi:hypothetical protein
MQAPSEQMKPGGHCHYHVSTMKPVSNLFEITVSTSQSFIIDEGLEYE